MSNKLSIVIICWNDLKVIGDCLRSIYARPVDLDFEVILADNGSSDGSVAYIRERFPSVRIVENGDNIGFGPGNNAGFQVAQGEYVFILNPDTLVHESALENLVAYADRHPEAGAFGCRTLNPDGSLQHTAQPTPTVWRYLVAALGLRKLGRWFDWFASDVYDGWDGRTEREIGFQAGCSLLIRRRLLKELRGFDERFFHQAEDADLCHRVWLSGSSVLYCPYAEITHIGGQNRGTYSVRVVIESERSKYKYFYKHYGRSGAARLRCATLLGVGLRYAGYSFRGWLKPSAAIGNRLAMYRILFKWTWALNPVRFVEHGMEPDVGYQPLAPAPKLIETVCSDGTNGPRATSETQ